MILGFLGKGGSGKSSVATQVALWLNADTKNVLAIDADHNMDLAYNLFDGEVSTGMNYFGSSLSGILDYVGLEKGEKYDQVFFKNSPNTFSINPLDDFTETLVKKNNRGMYVTAAGPQTDNVLYGKSCSHSLTTPLKVYLPLLDLQKNDYVVVDEKAGADGVSTGIVTGVDVGVIVCEPALHSIKTAKQIAELMDFYETPYIFVANKIQSSDDKEFVKQTLGVKPTCYLLESSDIKRHPGLVVSEWSDEIESIVQRAQNINQNNRLQRTRKKFNRNQDFDSGNNKKC